MGADRGDISWERANHAGEMQSLHAGAYALGQWGGWRAQASLALSRHHADAERSLNLASVNKRAESEFHTHSGLLDLEAGHDHRLGSWVLGPMAGLRYTRYVQQGFDENKAGYLNMHLDGLEVTSFVSSLGVRASTSWDLDGILLAPRVGLSWRHEFEDAERELQTSFSGYGDAPFTVHGFGQPRDVAVLQIGLDASLRKGLKAYLQTDARQGSGYSAAALYLGLQLSF